MSFHDGARKVEANESTDLVCDGAVFAGVQEVIVVLQPTRHVVRIQNRRLCETSNGKFGVAILQLNGFTFVALVRPWLPISRQYIQEIGCAHRETSAP